jgi:hypothetical protein
MKKQSRHPTIWRLDWSWRGDSQCGVWPLNVAAKEEKAEAGRDHTGKSRASQRHLFPDPDLTKQ